MILKLLRLVIKALVITAVIALRTDRSIRLSKLLNTTLTVSGRDLVLTIIGVSIILKIIQMMFSSKTSAFANMISYEGFETYTPYTVGSNIVKEPMVMTGY
jgi:hypothetical protein